MKRTILVTGALTAAAALTAGLVLFEPWRLVTSTTVTEQLVTASAPAQSGRQVGDAAPVVLGSGPFRSLEHSTTGMAQLVRLPGGEHVVQFAGLSTSDGPDLHVYLSPQPATAEEAAFGAGFTTLGELKGNRGNQVYAVPAGVDVTAVRSVVIWCKRFSAGFGVAGLVA